MYDDPDFLAFLQTEESDAFDGTLLQEVETAIKSYNGQPYGDEEDGRSQVVSRDVSETVDYMLTSIVDVFAGTSHIAEFEPCDEGQEDTCDDATEAMHYIYRRKSGYRLIHDWAKAGLLEKIGVVKSCVEKKRKRVEGIVPDIALPEDAIAAEETGEFDEYGNPLFKVAIIEESPASFPDYFVPLEEFRVSRDARDLDSAVYLAHVSEKSLSELVEMGFDPNEVESLRGDNAHGAEMGFARADGRTDISGDRMGALRKVWLLEEYVLFDLNQDGIAERLCVHRVGNTILNIEEVDYQPFEYWCPYPMQGRLIGQSLGDKTTDIQRVNTALERNALDSLYMSVASGTMIHEDSIGDSTLDDLLTIRPRRIVRFKGNVPPIPEQVQDISQIAFAAIEFKIRQRESRTGITRLNKGVDEDTLNETASGQKALMTRGQQMERYIIRNFAEGVARLFMKKVALMRKYGQPFTIRVDGEYRQVDPSQWPEDMEINVKVGLGSGQKDERIAYRQLVAQSHALLKQSGSPLVTDENIYNNLTGLCKDAGLQPNDLYTHPEDNPQEPQPNPEMLKLQADVQAKQSELQMKHAHNQAQLQLKLMEIEGKMSLAREDAETKAVLEQQKFFVETQLARQQQAFEAQLEAMKIRLTAAQSDREAYRRERETDGKIKNLRKGGKTNK